MRRKNKIPLDSLTQYIPQLENKMPFATIVRDEPEKGVTIPPAIEYTELAKCIVRDFYSITDKYDDYSINNLLSLYEHSKFVAISLTEADVSNLDSKSVLALIAAVLHDEHWDKGTLYSFYYSGKLLEALKRLKECNS